MKKLFLIYFSVLSCAMAASRVEKVRNEKVIAWEEAIGPAETESSAEGRASVTVFLTDGTVVNTAEDGKKITLAVKRGEVIYRGAKAGPLRDTGTTAVRFVRIEFRGRESADVWGRTGFSPNYGMLVENGYVRAYNIAIPAGKNEPQHTHHDRVVVCLSGADLRHQMPDGHEEDSTLKTDDCLWRLGGTHIGKNIGKTDLWVIAIEPK